MRINTERNCKTYNECDGRLPLAAPTAKSLNVTKTNTLHQFDDVGIVGVQSPVGKIPIIFYLKENSRGGRRGLLYYDDYDSVCFMYPEEEHSEWCEQPYDMKYDKVEYFDNGVESGYHRNHGIFELWVSVFRKWYNGRVMFKPTLKVQGCGRDSDGYPVTTKAPLEQKTYSAYTPKTTTKEINHSCGCRKDK